MTDEDEDDADDADGPVEALVALVAVATLPAGILAAIFGDGGMAGVVFVVGWLFLVPVLAILSEYVDPAFGSTDGDEAVESASEDDALDRLRERYAAGEIDETEFERRLEGLIETEDVEVAGDVDPESLAGSNATRASEEGSGEVAASDGSPEPGSESESESEPEPEPETE